MKSNQSTTTEGTPTKVSVVIPVYNYARFVGDAVRSVLAQTFRDFELLVVDDGSTDNTPEVVRSFTDSRVVYLPRAHAGVSAAQNAGIRAARGEYITILGADDTYLPSNLEEKVAVLDSRPDIGLVCSDASVFDERAGTIIGRFWRDPGVSHYWVDPARAARQPLRELLSRGCFIAPQATMIRRSALDEVGLFDESLPTHEDWDLFVRLLMNYRLEIIDTPLVVLRHHGTNLSGNQEKMNEGALRAIDKTLRYPSLSMEERGLLRHRLEEELYFGRLAMKAGNSRAAVRAFAVTLRWNPWRVKVGLYLMMALLGAPGYRALRSWKERGRTHAISNFAEQRK